LQFAHCEQLVELSRQSEGLAKRVLSLTITIAEYRSVSVAEIAEKLKKQLELSEAALQRCQRLSVASRYAGAIMH
jgi:hypothetical protein